MVVKRKHGCLSIENVVVGINASQFCYILK